MRTFNPTKSLYLILCCTNVTLLLLILLPSNRPPLQQGGSLFALHIRSKEAAAGGGRGLLSNQASFMRKMASSLVDIGLPRPLHIDQQLNDGIVDAGAADVGVVLLSRSKFMLARRSLLHLAGAHQEPANNTTTNKVTVDTSSPSTVSKSTNIPTSHSHLPQQVNVDVSATFHVDYSGPKTHPPKNN